MRKPLSFSYAAYEALIAENEQLTADVEGWKQNFTTERNKRIAVTAERDAAQKQLDVAVNTIEELMKSMSSAEACKICANDHTSDCHIDRIPPRCNPKWCGTKGAEE